MKRIFFKTIALTLLLSTLSVLSGSCAGVWLGNKAEAKTFSNPPLTTDNPYLTINDGCGTDIYNTVQAQAPLSVHQLPSQHGNNLMPCCQDDNNKNNSLAANKKLNPSELFLISFFHVHESFSHTLKASYQPALPILPPPEQFALSTINIRI